MSCCSKCESVGSLDESREVAMARLGTGRPQVMPFGNLGVMPTRENAGQGSPAMWAAVAGVTGLVAGAILGMYIGRKS